MEHPKKVLESYGVRPKKSLGQNFITDEKILEAVAGAADLKDTDCVLEIGPGIGDLTRILGRKAGSVVAVEIDERLIQILVERLTGIENISIEKGDALDISAHELFDEPFKVVANIPYYITGAFLRGIYESNLRPQLMVLTIQEEVAQRLCAKPGQMSLMAVTVQYYAHVQMVRSISAGSFWPRPEVDSSLVRFDLKPSLPLKHEEEPDFFNIVRTGFSQKRKQLQKNLRQLELPREAVANALDEAEIDGARRAQTLSLEEWINLYSRLRF